MAKHGRISAIKSNYVTAVTDFPVFMYEAVKLGSDGTCGEVVRIENGKADLLVYGDTAGLAAGDSVLFSDEYMRLPNTSGGMFNALAHPLSKADKDEEQPTHQASYISNIRAVHQSSGHKNMDAQFISGIRFIDILFPFFAGGSALIVGASGTGKSVILRAMAKFCDVDTVIFVTCQSRNSDIVHLSESLHHSRKSYTTIFAHTADMVPEAAEIAVLNGIALACHQRDAGKRVLLLVDGLSEYAKQAKTSTGLVNRLFSCSGCCGASEHGGNGSITVVASSSYDGIGGNPDMTCFLSEDAISSGLYPSVDVSRGYSSLLKTANFSAEPQNEICELQSYVSELFEREHKLNELTSRMPKGFETDENKWLAFHAANIKLVFVKQWLCSGDSFCPHLRSITLLQLLKKLDAIVLNAISSGVSFDYVMELPIRANFFRLRLLGFAEFFDKAEEWLFSVQEKLELKQAPNPNVNQRPYF